MSEKTTKLAISKSSGIKYSNKSQDVAPEIATPEIVNVDKTQEAGDVGKMQETGDVGENNAETQTEEKAETTKTQKETATVLSNTLTVSCANTKAAEVVAEHLKSFYQQNNIKLKEDTIVVHGANVLIEVTNKTEASVNTYLKRFSSVKRIE